MRLASQNELSEAHVRHIRNAFGLQNEIVAVSETLLRLQIHIDQFIRLAVWGLNPRRVVVKISGQTVHLLPPGTKNVLVSALVEWPCCRLKSCYLMGIAMMCHMGLWACGRGAFVNLRAENGDMYSCIVLKIDNACSGSRAFFLHL